MQTAILLLSALAAPVLYAQLPDAATILDRYVEVTGGKAAYARCNYRVSKTAAQIAPGVTMMLERRAARGGRAFTTSSFGGATKQTGSANGVVWETATSTGARILKGKEAERYLAENGTFEEDEWREHFTNAVTTGEETVDQKKCYRVELTRKDGQHSTEFFDEQSGLQIAEKGSGESGLGFTEYIETYKQTGGITGPATVRIEYANGRTVKFTIENTYSETAPADAFPVPAEVAELLAGRTSQLPNAMNLLHRFFEVTGGSDAYSQVNSQQLKARMIFKQNGVTATLEGAVEHGKSYFKLTLPGGGTFEGGTDGVTAWQNSTMSGPKLESKALMGDSLLGPSFQQLAAWQYAFKKIETTGEESVNGSACYLVEMQASETQPDTSACFDKTTGLLTKSSTKIKTPEMEVAIEMVFSDYRQDGPIKTAHHLDTVMAGQPVTIDVDQLTINPSLPAGTFDLPPDVRALRDRKAAQIKK